MSAKAQSRLGGPDFDRFVAGQAISSVGSAFTSFALPLLVYRLTGSALSLGLATAVTYLPYTIFGLVVGAWVDRADRKRLMILSDVARALLIGTIAILQAFDVLSPGLLYVIIFASSSFTSLYLTAQMSAVPSLVAEDEITAANGRVQASYALAVAVGPLLATALINLLPLSGLFACDALSFLASAALLLRIRRDFPARDDGRSLTLRAHVTEALHYVFTQPLLRGISVLLVLVLFLASSAHAQLVLFAKQRLDASDAEVGWLFSAGGVGLFVFAVAAGALRKRLSMSAAMIGSVIVKGACIALLGVTTSYGWALVLWGIGEGMTTLFSVNSMSARQLVSPPHMLGRVISISQMLSWSTIPAGSLFGGFWVEFTHDVAGTYLTIGALVCGVGVAAAFSAVGRAERFLTTQRALAGTA